MNLFIKNIRWKPIVIIVVGLIAAVCSALYLRSWVSTHQEMINIPVPAHNISSGSIVTSGDLTMKPFVKQAFNTASCSNPQDIVGNIAAADLYAGDMIRRDKIISPINNLKPDEAFVTVKAEKLEEVLGGRLQANMLVDVLYNGGLNTAPVILGSNALVVAVTIPTGAKDQVPQYVFLKIKKDDRFNFARPLTGGEVLLVQTGWRGQEQKQEEQQQVQ